MTEEKVDARIARMSKSEITTILETMAEQETAAKLKLYTTIHEAAGDLLNSPCIQRMKDQHFFERTTMILLIRKSIQISSPGDWTIEQLDAACDALEEPELEKLIPAALEST